VNTKANQKLIHTPPKTLPMYGRGIRNDLVWQAQNPVDIVVQFQGRIS
jgi:hypothetical protein